jgi:CheY-like chemotaxis protein
MEPNMNRVDHLGLAIAPKVAPQTRRALETPAVLVAEDDSDSREMMKILLCSKGYSVIEAADGLQAVEVALTKLPDLILLDLELPALDGLRVTRNLRQHPKLKAVPIVVISGYDPNGHRQAALDAGCNDYLLKPIDFERLEEILHSSLHLTGKQR